MAIKSHEFKKEFVFQSIPINQLQVGIDNSKISQSNHFVYAKCLKKLKVNSYIFNYDMQKIGVEAWGGWVLHCKARAYAFFKII